MCDILEPPLQEGEVRVAIQAALTCGTDLKVFKRGYHARMIQPPAVFGHEFAGIISEVGQGAGPWQTGDRVVVPNSAPCGECYCCLKNQEHLCADLLFLNGAYAESIVIPERLVKKNMLRLRPQTDFRDAALVEPLACVVLGIDDCRLDPGDHVLVIGSGPIGLMFVALARNRGCQVTLAGRGEARLRAGLKLGAAAVIEVLDGADLPALARAHENIRYDVVVEAVGKVETWEAAVQCVRPGGLVNFFGGCPAGSMISLPASTVHYSALRLVASFHHTPRTVRRALEFIEAGVIRSADFVDGECALTDLPRLFRSMAAGNRVVKSFINVRV